MIIANNINTTIIKTENTKEFMKLVKNCALFKLTDKSLVWTLLSTLIIIKFDGSHIMHKHILEMTNLVAKLKTRIEVQWEFSCNIYP